MSRSNDARAAPGSSFTALVLEPPLESSCRRARQRLTLAAALSGAALGSVLALCTSLVLWRSEALVSTRAIAAVWIVVAAATASLRARQKPPSTRELVLAFDRRLGGNERLSAALACSEGALTGPLPALVRRQASLLLAGAGERHLPRVWRRRHWILVAGFGSFCLSLGLPAAHSPVPIALPGTRLLRWQHLGDLSPLVDVGEPPALTQAERRRSNELVARVQAFQQQMIAGLPPEQVGRELDQLQDSLREVLDEPRATSEQLGLRAAVAALREDPVTARIADLLEQNDLLRLDREVRRLSSAEERSARLRAQSSIAKAEAKARAARASAVARVLGEQSDLFEARAASAERIRELITQLGSAAPNSSPTQSGKAPLQTESGVRHGGTQPTEPGAAQKARSLASKLSHAAIGDEQDFSAPALAELEQLARTTSKDIAQELTQALQRFGAPAPSAERHQVMWETSRAVSRLQSALHGNATQQQEAQADGWGGQPRDNTGPRGAATPNSRGKALAHEGETQVIESLGLRARTTPPPSRGVFRSSFGQSFSESPLGSSGRLGRLSTAEGPTELQGVERPTIPSEYREQVSRYFSAE